MYLFPVVVALLALAAIFEGTEAGFLSMTEAQAYALAKKDKRAAVALRLKRQPRKLLTTLLIMQTVLNLGTSSLVAVAAERAYGAAGVGIATAGLTFVVLVFVNLVPKSVANHHPRSFTLPMARPTEIIMIILTPLVAAADWTMRLIVGDGGATAATEEEIRAMTRLAAKRGTVEQGEQVLIERVFLFNDITAADVLTPRELMVTMAAGSPLPDCLMVMNAVRYSRYPVVGDNGAVKGIIHIKDVLEKLVELRPEQFSLLTAQEIVRPVPFVSDTQLIDDLLRDFKRNRTPMAIVTDRNGEVVGLVTLEDLIEELVGEIADESDIDEHIIKRVSRLVVLVHGDIEIANVNRFLNVAVPDDGNRTIGRLITALAGGVPKAGTSFRLSPHLTATVEQVSRRRLTRVRLNKEE